MALKGSLVETLKEARPTMVLGVPRVWEKMMEGIKEKGKDVTGTNYIYYCYVLYNFLRCYNVFFGQKGPRI